MEVTTYLLLIAIQIKIVDTVQELRYCLPSTGVAEIRFINSIL